MRERFLDRVAHRRCPDLSCATDDTTDNIVGNTAGIGATGQPRTSGKGDVSLRLSDGHPSFKGKVSGKAGGPHGQSSRQETPITAALFAQHPIHADKGMQ
ncbi:hypothetical protein BG22_04570 [Bifidobacterium sp. UTBIF-78]|nr:hypothetical protein BG22_04570 [Bifidobacterium sp. UTBIF-78]